MAIYPKAFPLSMADLANHILVQVPLQGKRFMDETLSEGRAWTLAVKVVLDRLGKEHDFRSIYTDSSNGTREFMLDLVWWSHWGAMLACECEWGYAGSHKARVSAVAEDFDKLLSFKAPVKLMIFSSDAVTAHRLNCVGELDRYLSEYPCHIEGEEYLLIDFGKQSQAWSASIKKDGLDDSLRFRPLR